MTKPAWEAVLEAELIRYHEAGVCPSGLGLFSDLRLKILAEEARRSRDKDEYDRDAIAKISDDWRQRTVAEVLKSRMSGGFGCCNRYCDNQGCQCIETAERYEREQDGRGGSLAEYDRLHPTQCSICRDPNCDNPGGKH